MYNVHKKVNYVSEVSDQVVISASEICRRKPELLIVGGSSNARSCQKTFLVVVPLLFQVCDTAFLGF